MLREEIIEDLNTIINPKIDRLANSYTQLELATDSKLNEHLKILRNLESSQTKIKSDLELKVHNLQEKNEILGSSKTSE